VSEGPGPASEGPAPALSLISPACQDAKLENPRAFPPGGYAPPVSPDGTCAGHRAKVAAPHELTDAGRIAREGTAISPGCNQLARSRVSQHVSVMWPDSDDQPDPAYDQSNIA
jgi:hypothetical protein